MSTALSKYMNLVEASSEKYSIVNTPFFNLELESQTPAKFSWNGNAPDYFTSLTHNRIVEGANTGTISISYVPIKGESRTVSQGDLNYVEAALTSAKGKCRFQYGMTGYKSPYYNGLIYDYKAILNEGKLDYTFNVISREIGALNTVIPSSSDIDIPRERDSLEFNDRIELFKRVYYIIETYLDNAYEFDDGQPFALYESTENSSGYALVDFFRDIFVTGGLSSGLKKYYSNNKSDYQFRPGEITFAGSNALQMLNKLAQSLYNPSDPFEHYYMDIDNEVRDNNKMTIKLLRTKNKNVSDTTSSLPIEYAFNWYHRDSTVLSWQPEYKGVATIFQSTGPAAEVGIDENGKARIYKSELNNLIMAKGAQTVFTQTEYASYFSRFDFNSVQDYANMRTLDYRRIANYPYNAKITVLGIPTNKLYVGSHIIVRPYVQRQLHHSAGEYFVMSIDDTVDSHGFKTTMSLVRISDITDTVKTPLVDRTPARLVGGKATIIPITQTGEDFVQ